MTTLENRPNTALLVIDVQNDVVARVHDRDRVVAKIAGLVDGARDAGVPVVWVQHADAELVAGSEEWRIVAELAPTEAEPLVAKNYGDSFEDTTLESTLAGLGIGHLVVADAHTTEDLSQWGTPPPEQVIAHTNLYWSHQAAPGRTAQTTPAGDIVW